MLAFVRAAFAAALVLLLSVPTNAADKPFKRDDLADAAIKLEAQIKAEAGQVTKPAAALRREADAAFQRNDFRSGMQILGQIVAVAPDDSANWLRLAKTVLQIRPSNDRERTTAARACRDRRLYRLSALRQRRRGGREPGRGRAHLCRSLGVASGARCAARLARPARGRRGAATI